MLNDIDISLSLGQLVYGKKWVPVICFILMAMLFPILTLVICSFSINWNPDMIVTLILLNLFSLAILSLPLYIIIKDKWIKKQVTIWMKDSVKLEACSKKIDECNLMFLPKGIRIQVAFEMNGTKYVRNSTVKTFGGGKAYLTSFTKYADRKINVLYSPKYDEVMILKD